MRRLILAAGLLLAACADLEPFDPPVAGELNPEPGLLSGPSGEFVILRQEAAGGDDAAAVAPAPPPRRRLTDPPPP